MNERIVADAVGTELIRRAGRGRGIPDTGERLQRTNVPLRDVFRKINIAFEHYSDVIGLETLTHREMLTKEIGELNHVMDHVLGHRAYKAIQMAHELGHPLGEIEEIDRTDVDHDVYAMVLCNVIRDSYDPGINAYVAAKYDGNQRDALVNIGRLVREASSILIRRQHIKEGSGEQPYLHKLERVIDYIANVAFERHADQEEMLVPPATEGDGCERHVKEDVDYIVGKLRSAKLKLGERLLSDESIGSALEDVNEIFDRFSNGNLTRYNDSRYISVINGRRLMEQLLIDAREFGVALNMYKDALANGSRCNT